MKKKDKRILIIAFISAAAFFIYKKYTDSPEYKDKLRAANPDTREAYAATRGRG